MVSGGVEKVRQFSSRVPEVSGRFWNVPGWGHLTCGVHMDQEGGAAANAGLAAPALEAHVANKERGGQIPKGFDLGAKSP